MGNNCCSSKKK